MQCRETVVDLPGIGIWLVYSGRHEYSPVEPALNSIIRLRHCSYTTIESMSISCLEGQYCSIQDPASNKTMGVFTAPADDEVPAGRSKSAGREFHDQFKTYFSMSFIQSTWCPQQQGLTNYIWWVTNSNGNSLCCLGTSQDSPINNSIMR